MRFCFWYLSQQLQQTSKHIDYSFPLLNSHTHKFTHVHIYTHTWLHTTVKHQVTFFFFKIFYFISRMTISYLWKQLLASFLFYSNSFSSLLWVHLPFKHYLTCSFHTVASILYNVKSTSLLFSIVTLYKGCAVAWNRMMFWFFWFV